jgi:hypothetical protein
MKFNKALILTIAVAFLLVIPSFQISAYLKKVTPKVTFENFY